MSVWFGKVRGWLAGRKTYIAGGGLVAVAAVGALTGKLGLTSCSAIAFYGLGLCGVSARSNRQHQEVLIVLREVAAVGLAGRTGGAAAAVDEAKRNVPGVVRHCAEDQREESQ